MKTHDDTPINTSNYQKRLQHYVRGYGRGGGADALKDLLIVSDWQAYAQRELENRISHFIKAIDTDTVEALAQGRADIHEAVNKILSEEHH